MVSAIGRAGDRSIVAPPNAPSDAQLAATALDEPIVTLVHLSEQLRRFEGALHCGSSAAQVATVALEEPASALAHLSEQLRRFEGALHYMNQGLCMYDAQSRLVVCNHRYHEIFDLPYDRSLFGKTQEEVCAFLIAKGCYPPSVTLDKIRESTRTALARERGLPVLRELADGRIISILYRAIEGGGWVSTFEDITEQRRSQARIQHLAQHDGLTDLANARTFRDRGRGLLASARAKPILACSYLDLDRFKFVNDTYGHAVGDELLQAVAERLRAATRRGDVVSRLGGDEFAVIQRTSDEASALAFARRLAAEISAPYALSAGRVEVGVSIGLATCRGVAADIEPLIQNADLALRQAKATERGTVCPFEPAMSESARRRLVLENELQAAVAAEQFEVHYQPLVELDGERMIGVEALVRWRHPAHGLVPPSTFIPLAEEIGLIVPLGAWVLRRACTDAAGWTRSTGGAEVAVAVNVSSSQMRQKTFADMVLATLAETGLRPGRLEIEITESTLLEECEITMRNLHRLREAGVRFALDDFGTGYSSLSYLRRFPFDKIKIDRSFMRDAETSSDALAIIRAVAGLGSNLGITTLVEGVETESQLRLARAEGLGQVQGYLFSRPQPNARILELLERLDRGERGRLRDGCAAAA